MTKMYRRRGIIHGRPYIPGEPLEGIYVAFRLIPNLGGMILEDPDDPGHYYYITKERFDATYEPV